MSNTVNAASRLPEEFVRRMKEQLGDEFSAFLESYDAKRSFGLRLNTNKISPEEFERICPFEIRPIPWVRGGYFYNEEDRPSRCPLYQAGIYYLQDPGAMVPASLLPVSEGDRILDLCAAPGGKATALSARLCGTGFLAANDISSSRVKALLRNLELSGSVNSLILNEEPERLLPYFEGWFDKILLDAPCSGEGMFRKEESLLDDWTPDKSEALSKLQKKLVRTAEKLLRPGGMLLYSTCTFSRSEDEEVIEDLLNNAPEMRLVKPDWYEGFSSGIRADSAFPLENCVRIYPHRMESEGQFAALLMKEAGPEENRAEEGLSSSKSRTSSKKRTGNTKGGKAVTESLQLVEKFFDEIGLVSIGGQKAGRQALDIRGDKVYYVPAEVPDIRGLTFIRNGLYLGDLKKNRFEPSEALALSLLPEDAASCICLPVNDKRLTDYLSGAPIEIMEEETAAKSGWVLLCADRFPLAFGKLVNGQLKNKYPAGWRIS